MDFNDGDYGFGLGLACYVAAGIALLASAWFIAAPLIIAAFALCWMFG